MLLLSHLIFPTLPDSPPKVTWSSLASRDSEGMPLRAVELDDAALAELKFMAKREVQNLAVRLRLFDADKGQYGMILTAMRSSCATLLKGGSARRAFERLGGDALERSPLQDALSRVLSLPTFDAERVAAAMMAVECSNTFRLDDFAKVLKFVQPVPSLLAFRMRLVQRFGTIEASLDAFARQGLGVQEAFSIDQLEHLALGLGMTLKETERIFEQAGMLSSGGGLLTMEIMRQSLRHAHTLQQLHLLERYVGGPLTLARWLSDRLHALANTPLSDVLQPLGVSADFCGQLVSMLRDRKALPCFSQDLWTAPDL